MFPVNCTFIKRETVLLLKEQYVIVGLAGQTMLFFLRYFVITYCEQTVPTRLKCNAAAFRFNL